MMNCLWLMGQVGVGGIFQVVGGLFVYCVVIIEYFLFGQLNYDVIVGMVVVGVEYFYGIESGGVVCGVQIC